MYLTIGNISATTAALATTENYFPGRAACAIGSERLGSAAIVAANSSRFMVVSGLG
jgi:hypothetical protein